VGISRRFTQIYSQKTQIYSCVYLRASAGKSAKISGKMGENQPKSAGNKNVL
jgi:hypothetical protein